MKVMIFTYRGILWTELILPPFPPKKSLKPYLPVCLYLDMEPRRRKFMLNNVIRLGS